MAGRHKFRQHLDLVSVECHADFLGRDAFVLAFATVAAATYSAESKRGSDNSCVGLSFVAVVKYCGLWADLPSTLLTSIVVIAPMKMMDPPSSDSKMFGTRSKLSQFSRPFGAVAFTHCMIAPYLLCVALLDQVIVPDLRGNRHSHNALPLLFSTPACEGFERESVSPVIHDTFTY
jgi:hypothetical protein